MTLIVLILEEKGLYWNGILKAKVTGLGKVEEARVTGGLWYSRARVTGKKWLLEAPLCGLKKALKLQESLS